MNEGMKIDFPSFPRGISSEPFTFYSSLMFLGTGLTQKKKKVNVQILQSAKVLLICVKQTQTRYSLNILLGQWLAATADVTDHSPAAVKE